MEFSSKSASGWCFQAKLYYLKKLVDEVCITVNQGCQTLGLGVKFSLTDSGTPDCFGKCEGVHKDFEHSHPLLRQGN